MGLKTTYSLFISKISKVILKVLCQVSHLTSQPAQIYLRNNQSFSKNKRFSANQGLVQPCKSAANSTDSVALR